LVQKSDLVVVLQLVISFNLLLFIILNIISHLLVTGKVQAILGAVGQTVGEAASVAVVEAASVVLSTFNADSAFFFNLNFLYKNKAAVTMQAKIVTQTETMMTTTVELDFVSFHTQFLSNFCCASMISDLK
jgi:CTP synthase (UTP-ammonia lyase)